MKYFLFGLAILTMMIGHFFKIYRQRQLIEVYEKSNPNVLLRALCLGNVINFFLPFKVGDLFRSWLAGRKMKNGVSFSLATVIIDRVLDIIFVGILFLICAIFIKEGLFFDNTIFYG
ncbi:MAG: flippase-like domain-containing protein, partial [Bacilli bacterium]|nr:flippase-like domain-containing protein [Bacilli bacterium]